MQLAIPKTTQNLVRVQTPSAWLIWKSKGLPGFEKNNWQIKTDLIWKRLLTVPYSYRWPSLEPISKY